ncbi:MAG: MBOAT family protein, partial [Chloroflexota bacterium]
MLFTTPIFLFVFLPVTLVLHWIAPRHARNVILLTLSLLFYAWGELGYTLIMLISIGWNTFVGIMLTRVNGRGRAGWLAAGVVVNIGLLAVFKYAGFFVDNLNSLTALAFPVPEVHLPIGISFF